MTPGRENKRMQRALRTIPVDAVASDISADESRFSGIWCLVDGELLFVLRSGAENVVCWDDPLTHAQYVRWVNAYPERVHKSDAAALAFVRECLTPSEQE